MGIVFLLYFKLTTDNCLLIPWISSLFSIKFFLIHFSAATSGMFINSYGGSFTLSNSAFSNIAFSATIAHSNFNSIFNFAPNNQNTPFSLNFQYISFNSDTFDTLGFYFSIGTLNINFNGIYIENCLLNDFIVFSVGQTSTIYFGETFEFFNNTQSNYFFL